VTSEREARRALRLFLAWLAGVALFAVLSLYPTRFPYQTVMVAGGFQVDEVMHFASFALLALAAPLMLQSRLDAFLAVVLLVLLAVASEMLQLFIPVRRPALLDLAANAVGCGVGAGVGVLVRVWRNSFVPSSTDG